MSTDQSQLAANGRIDGSTMRVPLPTKLGFGFGDFGYNLVYQGTAFFLLFVYTDIFGVSPTVAGLIYALAMIWDAITDPIMGVIADRTRTRWGRYRPWIAIGAVPLGFGYMLAYWNPGFQGVALVIWLAFSHCFLRTAFTVANIPYSSLQARLTNDAKERTTLAGFRMIGAAAGGLSVALLTPTIVQLLGGGDPGRGFFLAGVAAGVLTTAILLYVAYVMREPEETDAAAAPEPMWRDIGAFGQQLVRNMPLAQMFAALIIASITLTMFSKNILYYFKYVLEAPPGAETPALIAVPVAMLLLVPLWVVLANRTSKRTAWLIGSAITATGFLAFYLNTVRDLGVTYAIIAVIATGLSSIGVLAWSILPDTVEWGEAKLGTRHEAKVFGFSAFAQKAALGINALLVGLMLDAVGYVANAPQTPETINGIVAMMSLIPLAGTLLTAAIMAFYPIDAKKHAELRAQIAARRAAVQGG
jgi:GPH family glycoside/pentoside/hexuronide:cation symporter